MKATFNSHLVVAVVHPIPRGHAIQETKHRMQNNIFFIPSISAFMPHICNRMKLFSFPRGTNDSFNAMVLGTIIICFEVSQRGGYKNYYSTMVMTVVIISS